MAHPIQSVRMFAGIVKSLSNEFHDFEAAAALTLIERDTEYECKFVAFIGTPQAITFVAPKNRITALEVQGVTQDPRGWEVSFKASLMGDEVHGTYKQPHDHGTFTLHEM